MSAASDNGNGTNDTIQLELRPKLHQSGIVHSFVFNTKANSVILSLNHEYEGKTVVCPINCYQDISVYLRVLSLKMRNYLDIFRIAQS